MPEMTPGINIIGDLTTDIGLSEATRMKVDALLQHNVSLSYLPLTYSFTPTITDRSYHNIPSGSLHPVNLLFYNFHDLSKNFTPTSFYALTGGKYTIGFWYWELSHFPIEGLPAVDMVDEIWVASKFVQESMSLVTGAPVIRMRPPVEVRPSARYNRAQFGLDTSSTIFLCTFNAASSIARKNPYGVIEAFKQAFGTSKQGGPTLVIKAQHLDFFPEAGTALRKAVDSVGGILLEDSLSRQDTIDLFACADVYISLHRSEGFGLSMAESMYLGKPVIGTNYSGNVDFMDKQHSFLVDYYLRPITDNDHQDQDFFRTLYPAGEVWAEPDLAQAAAYMHHLYDNPQVRQETGEHATAYMRENYSAKQFVEAVTTRLNEIDLSQHRPTIKRADYRRARARSFYHRFDQPRKLLFAYLNITKDAVAICKGGTIHVNHVSIELDNNGRGIISQDVLQRSPARTKIEIEGTLASITIYDPLTIGQKDPMLETSQENLTRLRDLREQLHRLRHTNHRFAKIPVIGFMITSLVRVRNLGHLIRIQEELHDLILEQESLTTTQIDYIAQTLARLEEQSKS